MFDPHFVVHRRGVRNRLVALYGYGFVRFLLGSRPFTPSRAPWCQLTLVAVAGCTARVATEPCVTSVAGKGPSASLAPTLHRAAASDLLERRLQSPHATRISTAGGGAVPGVAPSSCERCPADDTLPRSLRVERLLSLAVKHFRSGGVRPRTNRSS